jgi:cell pole-organizing protein PopZ
MTADSAQREPTMEEILASIRRIISEDDKPVEAGADVLELSSNEPMTITPKAAAPVIPPPAPPPAPRVVAEAPVIPPPPPAARPTLQEVLTVPDLPEADDEEDLMIVEHEDEPVRPAPPIAAAPAPRPAPAPRQHPAFSNETLVGEPAAAKAAGALGKLMGSMMVHSEVTLDDVVKEMLKPMLKDWLDANLPQLVEIEVQKEIERIRRMAR